MVIVDSELLSNDNIVALEANGYEYILRNSLAKVSFKKCSIKKEADLFGQPLNHSIIFKFILLN